VTLRVGAVLTDHHERREHRDVRRRLAQAELRKVLAAAGARVTDVELAVGHAHEHLDHAGHPVDPAQAEAPGDSVGMLLAELQQLDMAA
jgi:hypothetical protein